MPSTYSPTLKLELIGNGEQVNTWGETTNNNMGTLIEQAITGVGQITLTGDYTLTSFNGLPDDARNAVLVFGGALANTANVTAPSVEKTYIVANNSGANVVLKTSGSNGITLANGSSQMVYCDGVDFYQAINVNSVTGDITITGNQSVGNTFATYGNVTFNGNVVSLTNSLSFTSYTGIVDASKNTGALIPPTGTTGERPAQVLGTSRWNTTLGWYEIWNGLTWVSITGSYTASILVVGGGGGGGYWKGGGGGGAGGAYANTTTLTAGTSYPIVIGAGGSATTQGSNSTGFSQTMVGGGYGAGQFIPSPSYSFTGGNGGSGGGAIDWTNSGGGAGTAGLGTSGQGNAGGLGANGNGNGGNAAGGGGGAGAVGGAGTPGGFGDGGPGGIGIQSSITGTATYYAGGGGGGLTRQFFSTGSNQGGAGGLGGGGKGGGSNPDTAGVSGTANTGGGGGGSGENYTTQTETGAGAGGSGVVIVAYAAAYQRGTGGTVTSYSSGGATYYVHTFTSSGTFIA